MTDPTGNPYADGTPEAAEWARIAAAPAWHQRPHELRVAALARTDPAVRAELAVDPDAVSDAEFALRRLSSAGVIVGPDASQYQGRPAWATVRASGCAFAGYKVSEGRTFADPAAAYNRAAIPKAGLVPLGYHYLYYSAEYAADPKLWAAQADWFARNADPAAGHALDVEAAADAGHWLGVREWVAEYRRLFPDHPLLGYFNRSLWRNRSRVPYDPADLFDAVWHAGIGDGFYTAARGSLAAEWAAIKGLTNSVSAMGYPVVELWQISDHASVPGIAGVADGNAYTGSAAELAALFTGHKVTPPPKPPPPAATHPPFPLAPGRWFGAGGVTAHPSLHLWQRRMKDRGWPEIVDGRYGPLDARIARAFQAEKHLHVDSLVGRQTWDAAWTSKVT